MDSRLRAFEPRAGAPDGRPAGRSGASIVAAPVSEKADAGFQSPPASGDFGRSPLW